MTLTATEPGVTLYATEATEDGKPHREWLSVQFDKDTLDKDAPEGKREVAGLFIPYGVEIERLSWRFGTTKLRIEPGSMTVLDNAKTFYGHDWQTGGMPIGRVASSEDKPEGVRGVNALSKSAKASDVYELCLDGTLDRFSVGFTILAYSVEGADTAEPVLVVTEGEIFECSIVPFPAYDAAAVESVLHTPRKEITMPPTATIEPAEVLSKDDGVKLTESIEALSGDVQTLAAKLATLGEPAPAGADALEFDSYGEFVKAMLNRDHEKHAEAEKLAVTLAYEGGVSGDTIYGKTWVGDITRFIEKARKVWNLFESGTLPAEGMQLEYGQVVENTIDVAKQLAEGDKLVMGNIKVGTKYADVFTFGGASEMTFQQAQRSSINVLDFTWRSLARAYGLTTNAFAKSVLDTLVGFGTIGSLAALDETDAWTAFLIDAGLYYDDLGLEPEYLRVSKDVLTTLANLRQGIDGPYVLTREAGSINLLNAEGNVSGVKIVLTAGAGVLEFGNSFALKTFESSGAPTRLGPEQDITQLTQAVGVYGFDAIAVQEPKAILRAGA